MKKIVFLVFIVFLFFVNIVEAQPTHPHLFFNSSTIYLLREKASDTSINKLGYSSKSVWDQYVINPAKNLLKGPNYFSLPTYGYWTDASRDIEAKLVQLSLAYAITDNITYAQKLKNLTLFLASMSNWTSPYSLCRPNSCLDTAHISSGVALAYDMTFNILNETEETIIRDAIINKGIKPLYNDSLAMQHWYNFFALYTTGIGLSTIAILGEDGAKEWLAYSVNSTKNYFEANGKDSGTYEGQLYGAYSMNHLVSFMEALLFNNETNLYEHPFVQNLYKFAIYFVSPDGTTSANFEDARADGLSWSASMSSIASRTNNPYAQWYLAKRRRLQYPPYQSPSWYFYTIMGNLWFNNSITPLNPETNLHKSYSFNDVGDVALRTGWDNNDWLFAFKSGPYIAGHQHLAQNSFIINLENKWYLTDPGYGDSTRYNFTYGTVGHNSILVDGNFQKARNGSIEKFFTSDYCDYVLGEAGRTYDNINQFSRHVLFVKLGYFLIFDDIKSSTPHRYTWLFHTDLNGKVINESNNYFIEKTYKILIKQNSSSSLTFNITRYPGAESYGYYLETKNQINQNNIKSLTLLYPQIGSSLNVDFNPFYFNGEVAGSIIGYNNTTDVVIINPENGLSDYSTSIGNITSDAEVSILRNPGNLASFVVLNGTKLLYNNTLIFESQNIATAVLERSGNSYTGFINATQPNTIKLYVEKPVYNVFTDGKVINQSNFSFDSNQNVLTISTNEPFSGLSLQCEGECNNILKIGKMAAFRVIIPSNMIPFCDKELVLNFGVKTKSAKVRCQT